MTLLDVSAIKREIGMVPSTMSVRGTVESICGPVVKARLPYATIGDIFELDLSGNGSANSKHSIAHQTISGQAHLQAQVIAFDGEVYTLAPLGQLDSIPSWAELRCTNQRLDFPVSNSLLGCVVDGRGRILESLPTKHPGRSTKGQDFKKVGALDNRNLKLISPNSTPPHPLRRGRILEIFSTGVKVIDTFCTLGRGQRVAVFAQPGVGKTSLMSQIAKYSSADVNVIGLIGERGREVAEFINEVCDFEVRRRTVVVVSTSDEPSIVRTTAAYTATAIAEYFRDQGLNVLLQIDSLTRLFRSLRETGLAAGEIPVRRGYPPSVFSALPLLIERAGNASVGSITALYTVLLSADLDEDPMVEEVKGLTDGHFILSRTIAERGRYPAVDIVQSLSRLQSKLLEPSKYQLVTKLRKYLARYEKDRELLLLGAQADCELEQAIRIHDEIEKFLAASINGGNLSDEDWNFLSSLLQSN